MTPLNLFLLSHYHLRVRGNNEDQDLSKEHKSLFFFLWLYPYCKIIKFNTIESLF